MNIRVSFRPASTNIISQNNSSILKHVNHHVTYAWTIYDWLNVLCLIIYSIFNLLSCLNMWAHSVRTKSAQPPDKARVCKALTVLGIINLTFTHQREVNITTGFKHVSSTITGGWYDTLLDYLTMWFNISEHASWCHYVISNLTLAITWPSWKHDIFKTMTFL